MNDWKQDLFNKIMFIQKHMFTVEATVITQTQQQIDNLTEDERIEMKNYIEQKGMEHNARKALYNNLLHSIVRDKDE